MGVIYFRGAGVSQDYEQADNWLRKAAEQGDAEAQYLLGLYYYERKEGAPQDYAQALNRLRKAAVPVGPQQGRNRVAKPS